MWEKGKALVADVFTAETRIFQQKTFDKKRCL